MSTAISPVTYFRMQFPQRCRLDSSKLVLFYSFLSTGLFYNIPHCLRHMQCKSAIMMFILIFRNISVCALIYFSFPFSMHKHFLSISDWHSGLSKIFRSVHK